MKRRIIIIVFFIGIVFSVTGQLIDENQLYGTWYLQNQISQNRIDTLFFIKQSSSKDFSEWNFEKEKTGWIRNKNASLSKIKKWELKELHGSTRLFITTEAIGDEFINTHIEIYNIFLINDNELGLHEGDVIEINTKKSQAHSFYFTQFENDCDVFSKDSLILSLDRVKIEYPRIEFNQNSSFYFYYNIQHKTVKDKESGVWFTIEDSDKMQGYWKANDIMKDITISYGENKQINYSVHHVDNLIYLIRK